MAYINKEDLLGTINEVYERKYARCNWKPLYDLYRMCIRRINRAPDADVVEVRHGEWLMPLTDNPWQRGYFCRCLVCKYINHGHTLSVPDFCENCGAKMDNKRRIANESKTMEKT